MGSGHDSKRLPDTPWHIGFIKKEEDDPRRHKSRCIFKEGSTCKCGDCISYMRRCSGSSHCRDYAENYLQAEENRIKNKTIVQETRERAADYQTKMRIRVQKMLEEDPLKFSHLHFGMLDCPICKQKFISKSLKEARAQTKKSCNFCGAVFVKVNKDEIYSGDEKVFTIFAEPDSGSKGKMISGVPYNGKHCQWYGPKCQNKKSRYFNKECNGCLKFQLHERYKK